MLYFSKFPTQLSVFFHENAAKQLPTKHTLTKRKQSYTKCFFVHFKQFHSSDNYLKCSGLPISKRKTKKST